MIVMKNNLSFINHFVGQENNQGQNEEQGDQETGILILKKEKVDHPRKFKVMLHNDDYTTMEFVMSVLQKIFHKSYDEAYAIMMNIHLNGHGVCGLYSYEIAETKQMEVKRWSKEHGHPLKCTLEPE
jgi:ATP-dependent Clp protease adaptor protein ClpS